MIFVTPMLTWVKYKFIQQLIFVFNIYQFFWINLPFKNIVNPLNKLSSCIKMVRCNKCKKKIKKNHLNKVFQLILGNMDNGNFYGSEILYYHIEELTIPN